MVTTHKLPRDGALHEEEVKEMALVPHVWLMSHDWLIDVKLRAVPAPFNYGALQFWLPQFGS